MLSTCPSCLTQVSHAEDLFEVVCSCGAHFSPYLDHNTDEHAKNLNFDGADPAAFAESKNAFEELRQFGEGLGTEENTPTPSLAPPPMPPDLDEPLVSTPVLVASAPVPVSDMLLTPGETLQGYTLDNYFNPVSVVCAMSQGENPLDEAHQKLWQAIVTAGGNAGIGLRWVLNPTGDVVMSAVPVLCTKL